MSETIVERTPSAYPYPLLIKRLLDNPIRQFPNQGIVYGDFKRQTYRELGERIHRLASGLTGSARGLSARAASSAMRVRRRCRA